jgi:hypothetical protein
VLVCIETIRWNDEQVILFAYKRSGAATSRDHEPRPFEIGDGPGPRLPHTSGGIALRRNESGSSQRLGQREIGRAPPLLQ